MCNVRKVFVNYLLYNRKHNDFIKCKAKPAQLNLMLNTNHAIYHLHLNISSTTSWIHNGVAFIMIIIIIKIIEQSLLIIIIKIIIKKIIILIIIIIMHIY